MNNRLAVGIGLFCCILMGADGDDQERTGKVPDAQEHVEVINVEMLARVQRNGHPVGGLRLEDFILTENGRQVRISGFREVRRRISVPPAPTKKTAVAAETPGRLFVLCFWLRDREAQYAEALDHFFRDVFRPGDQVLLVHGRDVLAIHSPGEVSPVRERFEAGLRAGIDRDNVTRAQLYAEIDLAISDYVNRTAQEDEAGARMKLQTRISESWKEFRARFLKADPGSLVRLADSLKPIRLEKWVLIFLQEELFPQFPEDGAIPAFRNRLDEMSKSLLNETSAFNERLRSAFIAADATVSLIRLGSNALEEQGRSPHYRQQAVYSNRDECFRKISGVTGGVMVTDNKLARALDHAADQEDIHYVIYYAPEGGRRKRNVRLACRDVELTVVSTRHVDFTNQLELAISGVGISESTLTFTLSNFARLFDGERLRGRVRVHVTASGAGALRVEHSRELSPDEPSVQVPVALRLPRGRRYSFRIQVQDVISGRETVAQATLRNL